MAKGDTGPHVQAAMLCEKVIEDKQNVLTLVRVVDELTHTVVGPEVPDEMPQFTTDLTMVVMLKADQARGRYSIKIRPWEPSGRDLPVVQTPLHLTPGYGGVNLVLPFQFPIEHEGVYWFDVLFSTGPGHEDRLLSRVPLHVKYQPQRVTTG
jgi:hypothetical protein